MRKSVETQLLDFLKSNPSKFASVTLEKMEWKNKNGSPANPRTIIRRLQENTYWETDTPAHKKNLQGILIATYENNTTFYQIKEGHEKKPHLATDETKPPIWDDKLLRWRPHFTLV